VVMTGMAAVTTGLWESGRPAQNYRHLVLAANGVTRSKVKLTH
jgi:hypothetical protein